MNCRYETTFEASWKDSGLLNDHWHLVGPIELLVHYTYSAGRPARIRYDENDHPADPAEVEITKVEMEIPDGQPRRIPINPHGGTSMHQPTKWVPAFGWLNDWAVKNISTDDLVQNAQEDER